MENHCAGCGTTENVARDHKSGLYVCVDCKPIALEILQDIATHVQYPNN